MGINNNGGGIFSTLPHRGVDGFETIFGTPHNLDIAKIAQAFGLMTSTVEKQSELIAELSKPVVGLSLVVVSVPDRESNADNLEAIYSSMDSIESADFIALNLALLSASSTSGKQLSSN